MENAEIRIDVAEKMERLRSLIMDLMSKHLYSSAIFYADKLVTLSDSDQSDMYLLAQAYFLSKQYRRAVNLVTKEDLFTLSNRFKYLAARCLEELKAWDECLSLLDLIEKNDSDTVDSLPGEPNELKMASGIFLVRGRVHEAMDHKVKALNWYKEALKCDPRCYEAFERIVSGHLMSTVERYELIKSMEFDAKDEWLFSLYCDIAGVDISLEDKSESHDEAIEDINKILLNNLDVQSWRAERYYREGDYEKSYNISNRVLALDPFRLPVIGCHLASGLELGRKNELFIKAHRLVADYPHMALSWFAVGCYYTCVGQNDNARRHFFKGTQEDPNFLPSWLGFGHAYAIQDESDQAMAAYRTINRKFPGCHLGHLCIGVEYQRINNLHLAFNHLQEAKKMCPSDPLVYHELGVVAYKCQEYEASVHFFNFALKRVKPSLLHLWESTLLNMGHSLRKLKRYNEAMEKYEECLSVAPTQSADVFSAMGFTAHLQGEKEKAIDLYHMSLGIKPNDSLVEELLHNALTELLERIDVSDI